MSLYGNAVDLFIRPTRSKYVAADLGPVNISFAGKRWHREDFAVPNDRGQLLQASWWRIAPSLPRPCVIYLHTNSVRPFALFHLIPADISLLAFDCAGSGLSEGDFVTLGAWEKRDVASILAYVLGSGQATSIGLWGRSMGAVTALLAGDLHRRFVRVIIADSSFASLPRLVQDVAQGRSTSTPKALVNMLVSLGLKVLGETFKQRAQFRIAEVDPISVVENSTIPTLYMHADRDGFVLPEHSRDLHAKQKSENKRFAMLSGDHNGIRGVPCFDAAAQFLFDYLLTPEERSTQVTIPRLNLISSSLYYVNLNTQVGIPASVMNKELPLTVYSPMVAAVHKNSLRLALIYSDELVIEQPFGVATELRYEEGGVVSFNVTRVVLPIPIRFAFASADAREFYAMLSGAIIPAPGGAPPPQQPLPAMAAPPPRIMDLWEAADPSFAQLKMPRKTGLSDSDKSPLRGLRIMTDADRDMARATSPTPSRNLMASPTTSHEDLPAPGIGTVQELQRSEADTPVSALVATEQCVWGLSVDTVVVWDSFTGVLLERRRLTPEPATHALAVGNAHVWLFCPSQLSVWSSKLLEPTPERYTTASVLLPSAQRRDWKPLHVVLRGNEVVVYKKREDTEPVLRLGLRGATYQRSSHPDYKHVLLVREAAPIGSKASALLGMVVEPLLIAMKSDDELGTWFYAVQHAMAAIDTGRCAHVRTSESGMRNITALLEAESRVWVASGERAVIRVFDAVTSQFRVEYLYLAPEHAPNELISTMVYFKDCIWAALGRDIVKGSATDFSQRRVLSGHHLRISHLQPQESLIWSASSDSLRQWSVPHGDCVRSIDRSGIEPLKGLYAPPGLLCVVSATSLLVLNSATGLAVSSSSSSSMSWTMPASSKQLIVASTCVWWHDDLWLFDAQGVRYILRVVTRKPVRKTPAALFEN